MRLTHCVCDLFEQQRGGARPTLKELRSFLHDMVLAIVGPIALLITAAELFVLGAMQGRETGEPAEFFHSTPGFAARSPFNLR